MVRLVISLVLGLLISAHAAYASERRVTLSVSNMFCEACPYIVKKTLESVPGVAKATVSFKDKTAVVVFDDSKASLKDLTAATAKAGFPSELKS
jgi:mercuric ion binding protein